MKLPKTKLPAGFRFDREEANERTEALHDTAQPSTELETGASFAQRIHQRFKGLDGDSLVIPERQPGRPLPDFGQH